MKRTVSELIALVGIILALEACNSSSNQPGTNATDSVNGSNLKYAFSEYVRLY